MGRRNRVLGSWLGVAGAVCLAIDAHAQTINSWISPLNGFWEESAKWSLGVAPTNPHSIYITNALTKTVTVDNVDVASFPSTLTITNLTVGGSGGTTNTLQLTNMAAGGPTPLRVLGICTVKPGGLLLVTNSVLRVDGVGPLDTVFLVEGEAEVRAGSRVVVTNGTTTVGLFEAGQMRVRGGEVRLSTLGVSVTDPSSVTVSGGKLEVDGIVYVAAGVLGHGSMWVTGGEVINTNGQLVVGSSGIGEMVLSNGTVRAKNVEVGYNGIGKLTVAGGTMAMAGPLNIGISFAGHEGTGVVHVTNGQLVITNNPAAVVPDFPNFTVDGIANLYSGELLLTNSGAFPGQMVVGRNGTGQFTVTNGLWRTRNLSVGSSAGARGEVSIRGGTNEFLESVSLGSSAGATGTVWVTGGHVNAPDAFFDIGNGGVGQMVVSNGTHVLGDVDVGVPSGSQGTLTIAGGQLTFAGGVGMPDHTVGQFAGSTGTVWITGGQVKWPQFTVIGQEGVGQTTVSNGVVNGWQVDVGQLAGASGLFRIAGGTVSIIYRLTVGNPACSSTAKVVVESGGLYVTNDTASAVLDVQGGTLIHTGGALVIDQLIVTNACARFISTGSGLSVSGMLLAPGQDADGDGLPNDWETAFGLDPLSPSGDDGAAGDPDGDGFTNAEEFAACTDPLDSSSLPAIKSIAIAGDDVVIHIDTHCQGYTYQLRRRAAIETAPWVDVPGPAAVVIGNGGDVVLRHVNGALNGKQFYQVRISPPGP